MRLPAISNAVEHMTAPTTRWRSRAATASISRGPSPGQLMTISTTTDALSSVATESPSSEIKGFAAARKRVAKEQAPLGDTRRPGRLNERRTEDVDQAGANMPDQHRKVDEGQRRDRQEEV